MHAHATFTHINKVNYVNALQKLVSALQNTFGVYNVMLLNFNHIALRRFYFFEAKTVKFVTQKLLSIPIKSMTSLSSSLKSFVKGTKKNKQKTQNLMMFLQSKRYEQVYKMKVKISKYIVMVLWGFRNHVCAREECTLTI